MTRPHLWLEEMDDCFQKINAMLLLLSTTNSQFPFLAWSGEACTGTMYPPAGSFGYWDQAVSANALGFTEIRSMFIPHQSVIKVWSNEANPVGYYSVSGPLIVPDNRSFLANWSRWDGTTCTSGDTVCGKKVQWIIGYGTRNIGKLIIHNPVGWTSFLATAAARGDTLSLSTPSGLKQTYTIDYDALYTELCTDGQNRFACGCHDAYQALLREHPAAASKSYINLTPNSCNPSTQYVPSNANVGNGSLYECANMINAQLRSGTFPTLTNGGYPLYMCANKSFTNAYSDGSTVTTTTNKETNEDKTGDDAEQATPAYIYIVMSILIFAALVATVYAQCTRKRIRRTQTYEFDDD